MLLRRYVHVAPALLVALGGLFGCSGDGSTTAESSSSSSSGSGPTAGPTYYKDIAPILQKSCQSCHHAGDIAPFGLTTYEEAVAAAPLMVIQTKERAMPPWGALDSAECQPRFGWKDDLRLSDAEIKLFEEWSAAGTPEGDPKDGPAPVVPPSRELDGKTHELPSQTPYVTSGDSDEFICFTLDPKLAKESYLNGWGFIPGNSKVVHHILLFRDPNGEGAQSDAADGVTDGAYKCFGGPGIGAASLVAGWAPGGVASSLPPEVGITMAAGEKMVMQIHYHPGGTTADPDQTKVQLRFSDVKPTYALITSLRGNFQAQQPNGDGLLPGPNDGAAGVEFKIPAGASGHTETMQFTVPDKIGGFPTPQLGIYSIAAHMHIVGVDEKIDIERAPGAPGPASECLLHEPQWNFSWQRAYAYDAPLDGLPTVGPGDKVTIRCTYENTLQNKALAGGLKEQGLVSPVDVSLGESTLEEMCLTGIAVLLKN